MLQNVAFELRDPLTGERGYQHTAGAGVGNGFGQVGFVVDAQLGMLDAAQVAEPTTADELALRASLRRCASVNRCRRLPTCSRSPPSSTQ